MASLVPTPPAPTPGAAAPAAPKHLSFLKKLGQLGLDAITKVLPIITKTAQAAEPTVDLLFPMEGPLFNSVVNAICLAEVAGTNAAATQSNGLLKFQAVWNAVSPQLLDLANTHGLISDEAEGATKNYIQAIFDLLNGPAKSNAPAATAAGGAPAAGTPPATPTPTPAPATT